MTRRRDDARADLFTEPLIKRASLSPCGRYRYRLSRTWDVSKISLAFVMLNPSTADSEFDDPTVRRCMSFARREGYGGIHIANLFALRTPSPAALWKAEDRIGGVEAERAIVEAAELAKDTGAPIVCAWGADARGRGSFTIEAMRSRGARLVCLGKTRDGSPRHPLYVRGDQPLEPFP
jgi:hypothetical protein